MMSTLFASVRFNGPVYRSGALTGQYELRYHGMGQNAPTAPVHGHGGRQVSDVNHRGALCAGRRGYGAVDPCEHAAVPQVRE